MDRRKLALLAGLVLCLALVPAYAASGKKRVDFDHLKTGFPLAGLHATTPCETCHNRGVFKGTPTQCAACHRSGGVATTAKPANHIATNEACDQCHTSTATWTGARFRHLSVKPGTCVTCHDDRHPPAEGKPVNHIQTTATCDTCHRTTAWIPALAGGTLPPNHRPVPPSTVCTACHLGGGTAFTHPSTMTGCATCHNGTTATGRPNTVFHTVPSNTNQCETCHRSTAAFSSVTFSHTNVTPGTCARCHDGSHSPAVGKPSNHIQTTAACDSCHRTNAWVPASTGNTLPSNHRPIPAGTSCATCHVGGSAAFTHPATRTGCGTCHIAPYVRPQFTKPATVFHTVPNNTNQCGTCHLSTAAFSTVTFSHTNVIPGTCARCHDGSHPPADGKPSNHIQTTASCDSCHRTTAWTPALIGNTLPPNHRPIPAGTSCTTCHVAGSTTFTHPSTTTGCGTCHVAPYVRPQFAKPATVFHTIPTNAIANMCSDCHKRTTSFKPAQFTHSGVVGQCKSCHDGSHPPARGKPGNHIPFETQLVAGSSMRCESCHTTAGSWNARMDHNGSQGNGAGWCKGCHERSTNFLGNMEKKSLTHEKKTGVTDCSQSGCHRPLGNEGTTYISWD